MKTTVGSQAAANLVEGGVENLIALDGSRRRCVPYTGLALSHEPLNCPDLLYVYEQLYEIRIRRGSRKCYGAEHPRGGFYALGILVCI